MNRALLWGVALALGWANFQVAAQPSLSAGTTVGMNVQGEASATLRLGVGLDELVQLDSAFDLDASGLTQETLGLSLTYPNFEFTGGLKADHQGVAEATLESTWTPADFLEFTVQGDVNQKETLADGTEVDATTVEGTLGATESATGFDLELSSDWDANGLTDLLLSSSKAFELFEFEAQFDALVQSPSLTLSGVSVGLPVNLSWGGELDKTGLGSQTFGLHSSFDTLEGAVLLTLESGSLSPELQLDWSQDNVKLGSDVVFEATVFSQAGVTFELQDDQGDDHDASVTGELTLDDQGLQSGTLEAELHYGQAFSSAIDVTVDEHQFQEGNLTLGTVLAEDFEVELNLATTEDEPFTGTLTLSTPWQGLDLASETSFDLKGFSEQTLSVDATFSL